jgi:hypothetical protein
MNDEELEGTEETALLEETTEETASTETTATTEPLAAPEIDYEKLAGMVAAKFPQAQSQTMPAQQEQDPYEALAEMQYTDPAKYARTLVSMAAEQIVGQIAPVLNPIAQNQVEAKLYQGLDQAAIDEIKALGITPAGMGDDAIGLVRDAAIHRAQQKSGALNARPPVGGETGVGRVDNFSLDGKSQKTLTALDQLSRSLNGKPLDKAELVRRANKN